MEVKVNGMLVQIFEGAKVQDVIRKYSLKEYKEIRAGNKVVVNKNHYPISLDGELSGLEEFRIIRTKEEQDVQEEL